MDTASRERNKKVLIIVLVILGSLALLVAISALGKSRSITPSNPVVEVSRGIESNVPPAPEQKTVPGWTAYKNEKYGFRFQYPIEAKITTPPGNNEVLSMTLVEFEKESSMYNRAAIDFQVSKKKGMRPPYPQSDQCKFYDESTKLFGDKTATIAEYSECSGNEASGGGRGLRAIISISDTEELVYHANLSNAFIAENDLGIKILDTLSFGPFRE